MAGAGGCQGARALGDGRISIYLCYPRRIPFRHRGHPLFRHVLPLSLTFFFRGYNGWPQKGEPRDATESDVVDCAESPPDRGAGCRGGRACRRSRVAPRPLVRDFQCRIAADLHRQPRSPEGRDPCGQRVLFRVRLLHAHRIRLRALRRGAAVVRQVLLPGRRDLRAPPRHLPDPLLTGLLSGLPQFGGPDRATVSQAAEKLRHVEVLHEAVAGGHAVEPRAYLRVTSLRSHSPSSLEDVLS